MPGLSRHILDLVYLVHERYDVGCLRLAWLVLVNFRRSWTRVKAVTCYSKTFTANFLAIIIIVDSNRRGDNFLKLGLLAGLGLAVREFAG